MRKFFFIACYLLLRRKKQRREEEARTRRWIRQNLTIDGRRRRDRRYPRASLRSFAESPFKHLFDNGNEQSLINATGVDHAEFNKLLDLFKPIFDGHILNERTGSIRRRNAQDRGRPRSIDAAGCLGLILIWYRTTGPINRSFPLMFGLTQTPLERWLKFGKRCLFVALHDYIPKLPSAEDVQAYKNAISAKYPHAADVAFAIDGCKMDIQAATNPIVQRQYFNGWTHGHYVSNVFVFAPDGKIICCVTNAPGSLHDSNVADHGVYDKLEYLYHQYHAKTVADAAFTGTNFIVKSGDAARATNPQDVLLRRDATSIRQMAEWGMRQIKAKFPRLCKCPIAFETAGHRRMDIALMVRLYQHQVQNMGMNQILSTFMPERSAETHYFQYGFAITETGDDTVANMNDT
jgi:hypothetical protein